MLCLSKKPYRFTITDELDEDYLKYLRRRANMRAMPQSQQPCAHTRLDISLDDDEGDVVAGLAAYTSDSRLQIDTVWVHPSLNRGEICARLVSMAEQVARERGCTVARVCTCSAPDDFLTLGYVVSGKMVAFPDGVAIFWLEKPLQTVQVESA